MCIIPNKKDLRFIKTEKLIEDTYVALKKKSRQPIKVNELCKAALINKSTFYAHYETMSALHEHVCRKLTEEILSASPNIDLAFSNTRLFVESLVSTIQKNMPVARVLFGDNQTHLVNVVEECLLKRFLRGDEEKEKEMAIIFAIGGAARILVPDQSQDRIEITIHLIKRVFCMADASDVPPKVSIPK